MARYRIELVRDGRVIFSCAAVGERQRDYIVDGFRRRGVKSEVVVTAI